MNHPSYIFIVSTEKNENTRRNFHNTKQVTKMLYDVTRLNVSKYIAFTTFMKVGTAC